MALVGALQAGPAASQRRAFFSPLFDFLCLGGGSLLILPVAVWLVPDDFNPRALGIGLILSTFLIHPHFAHSYQIFYRSFGAILRDRSCDPSLRLRYLWAGLAAPLLLALFIAASLFQSDVQMLALAGNLMVFLVGWHYVRQGYGILIADTVLRRSFFNNVERTVLVLNAYGCWLVAWLVVNKMVAERDLYGLSIAAIDLPDSLLWPSVAIVAATSLAAIVVLVRHAARHRNAVPIAGIGAYMAALYPWVFLIREPVVAALIPAMHALQYQVIVWRYKINLEVMKPDGAEIAKPTRRFSIRTASLRVAAFILCGIALGIVAFFALPSALCAIVPYDHAIFGDYLFFFVFYVFINIHHYFIDNAMWRKENPHTLRHVFGLRTSAAMD